jgi:hypothetical protein
VVTAPPASTLTGPLLLITPQVVASPQDYGVIEPTSINPAAAAHTLIIKIVWSSWTNAGAKGSGYVVSESCVPNCAQGNVTQVPVVIQLGSVVNNRYTSMKWGTSVLQGPNLILVGSLGGKRVSAPAAAPAPPAPPATSAAPPVPVRNYNDPQQLAQAVGGAVKMMNGRAVTGASCQATGTPHTFRCVVNQGGSSVTAIAVVSPDGQSFSIPNPPTGG